MSTDNAPSQFTVAVVPLGEISSWQIKLTTWVLKQNFGVKTIVLPPTKIPSQYFSAKRDRYKATQLLEFLFFLLPKNAQRIMGIINGDMEDKDNQFCFGYSSMCDRVAICSVPQILGQQSGQIKNENDQNLASSLIITHEFGHTLGLDHCGNPKCAMNEDALKTILCDQCQCWADRELKVALGGAEDRFSLAETLFKFDCLHEAVSLYQEVIARAPNEPLYHHRLAMALHKQGKKGESIEEMVRAIELSNDDRSFYNAGLICLESEPQQAENFFAKAATTAKDPKFTQKLIGQAYREITHDVERASRHYQEYLRLGGDDPDVVEWMISRGQLDKS